MDLMLFFSYGFAQPPNGLAFSCRERAGTGCQNTNDLAREAVNCNAVLDGTGFMVTDLVA